MTRIRGHVELVSRQEVRGWAFDEDAPGTPVTIELLSSGRRIADGTADQPRDDLAELKIGRTNCGFAISLPGGTGVDLGRFEARAPGAAEALPIAEDSGVLEGYLEQVQGRTLSGWAWHCGHPRERIRLAVRHRGQIAASGYADDLREDLIGAGVGDGRHGFVIALRVVEPPYDPRALTVEFESSGQRFIDLRPAGEQSSDSARAAPGLPPAPRRPRNLRMPRTAVAAEPPPPAESRPKPQPAPAPAREAITRPEPGLPTAAPKPEPASAPRIAAPASPPPPAKPGYTLSPEAYEALRGALDFGGDESGLP